MAMHARGLPLGDSEETRMRAREALAAHGAVVARVCMALLGDANAATVALEQVAQKAAGLGLVDAGEGALPRLLGLARLACANQLSRMPLRTGLGLGGEVTGDEAAAARTALGRLKPTEREAVILHLVGGLDAARVGEACGVDVETARGRIARGMSQLVRESST